MQNSLKIYEPDNSIKKGYWSILSEIFTELIDNRWLTYQLFKRDLFAMYKQSIMGVFWVFIMPLVSIATFVLLSYSGVFNVGEISVPYPIYAGIGMAFWQLFSIGLISSTNSLVEAGTMVKIINFSKKSLVIASTAKALVSFLIQLVLVITLFAVYRIVPSTGIFYILIVAIPLFFLTLGLGLILALLNGVMRDIGNILSIFITFLMFLTPVLYAKPKSGILGEITRHNPLYYFISAARNLILNGSIPESKGFLISCAVSFFVFFMCLIIFHLTETRITERV